MAETKGFLRAQRQLAGNALWLTVAFGSFAGWLMMAQAWLLARVVHQLLFEAGSLAEAAQWLWWMVPLFVVRALLVHGAERTAFAAAARVKQDLRQRLHDKMQRLGPMWLSGERSGELATLLAEGIESLEGYYARYLPAMSLALWVPLSILVFVLAVDGRSALVMIVTAPLIPFFMILIGRGAERLNQQQWQQLARLGARFLDAIQGLAALRLFNASRREAGLLRELSEAYRDATMRVLRVAFLSSLALEFLATVSIALVAVLLGFRLLFGEIGFQSAFFVLLLAPEFYLPLRSLGAHYHARMEALASAGRILQVLQQPEPPVWRGRKAFRPGVAFGLRVENLHFRYGERPALAGVELELEPGERVALVGPSGAGKSTLIQLLLGFMPPQQGRISVDGQDLAELDPRDWRRQIAWVPQNPRLFAGSIADNLTLGLESVGESAMREALDQACALDFVEALPQGLRTRVGEGGRALSGGQCQRLALARAFLRDARLLLLDEPTAHLDHDSERGIAEALARFANGRSLIQVAHRLASIRRADRILVMENGRIVEQGSHRQLLRQNGLYRQMLAASGGLA